MTSAAPASDAVSYTVKGGYAANHTAATPFTGPPTPENIKAWEDLVRRKFALHVQGSSS